MAAASGSLKFEAVYPGRTVNVSGPFIRAGGFHLVNAPSEDGGFLSFLAGMAVLRQVSRSLMECFDAEAVVLCGCEDWLWFGYF